MATLTHSRPRLNEPIAVPAKQNGVFPKVFVWRGQRHDIRSVETCHTEVRRDWRGHAEFHRFRVRTNDAAFDLLQDLARDVWVLEQVFPNQM